MVGGFFDLHHLSWGDADLDWFEQLLEEQDVDIMAWAMRRQPVPEPFRGEMMNRLVELDYIKHPQ